METKYAGAAGSVVLLASLAVAVSGVEVDQSGATCYETRQLCHGIPLGDSCLGSTTYSTSFEETCEASENISKRCDSLADRICSNNNGSIGTRWASKTKVLGQSCRSWHREYGIELRSC